MTKLLAGFVNGRGRWIGAAGEDQVGCRSAVQMLVGIVEEVLAVGETLLESN